jgi:hypothetical protein
MVAAMSTGRLRIRVTMNGDLPLYELMDGDTKLCDVSRLDIIEMILQFVSCLRWAK